MGRKPRAAGYFRISNEAGRGDKLEAPNIYRRAIEHHAAELECDFDPERDLFSDIDVSGGVHPLDRGGFSEWHSRNQEWDVLIVPDVSRFSRDVASGTEVGNRLHAEGIRVEFIDRKGLDRSTAIGRFTFGIDLGVAQYIRDKAAESFNNAKLNAAEDGRPAGYKAPYGYIHIEHGVPTINAPEAAIVREVFRRKARGESLHAIAKDLNARHVPGPRGGAWSRIALRRLVVQRFYVGQQEYAGKTYQGAWEPLVDRETFETANALLSERAKGWRSGLAHPLTGLLTCGRCAGRMYHNGRPAYSLYRCQECGATIDANRAESAVSRAFLKKLSTKHAQKALAAPASLFRNGDDAHEAALLEKEARKLDARIDGLIDARVDAPASQRSRYDRKLHEAQSKLDVVNQRLVTLKAHSAQDHQRRATSEELRQKVADLPAVWSAATPQEQATMLRLVLERVLVVERPGGGRGKEVEIQWADWL